MHKKADEKAERKIWKKLEKALETRVAEARFCDDARKELQKMCGTEIAEVFWQGKGGYVVRPEPDAAGIPVGNFIECFRAGQLRKKSFCNDRKKTG